MRKLILLALLFSIVISGGCNRKPLRLVIGVAISDPQHPAVKLAVKQINDAGGINGIPLEAAGFDLQAASDYSAPSILSRADQFSRQEDLIAVIGHSDSSSTLSAAAVYNQNGVPQIVTIATNPAITNIGSWTYRLCLSDAAQGPALAEYAVKDWGKRRIGIIYVNDAYGRGLAQLFEGHAVKLGAHIISRIMHRNILDDEDKALIQSSIQRFKAEGEPDLIVLFQRIPAAEWTIKTLRDAGIRSSILGGDSLAPVSLAQLHPDLMEGVRVSQFFYPLTNDARAAKFIEEFRQFTGGQEPDYGHAFAYDAVFLLRDAAMHGGLSREGVKAYLDKLIAEKRTGLGVAGSFVLGSDHDARREMFIVENHRGAQRFLKALRAD